MSRKIIQIAVVVHPSGPDWNAFGEIYAVADDGTLWVRDTWKDEALWRGLPSLPDAKESNTPDERRAVPATSPGQPPQEPDGDAR